MILSPYNPLDFGTDKFTDRSNLASDHQQTWSQNDTIWLEVVHDYPTSGSGTTELLSVKLDNTTKTAAISNISIYNGKYCSVWSIALSGQSTTDTHQITITETISGVTTELTSNQFQVLAADNPLLDNTLLIAYTNKDNRVFRNHVWINPYTNPTTQYTFMWRVEGGFKDSGRQFAVDSEQFTTTKRNTLDIYSLDYTIRQLTLGLGEGVPIWYAEMLNRILSLSNIIIANNNWCVVKNNSVTDGKRLDISNNTATETSADNMRINKVTIPNNAIILSAQFASPTTSQYAANAGYAFYDSYGNLIKCGQSLSAPNVSVGYEWKLLDVPNKAKYFAVTGVKTSGSGLVAYNFDSVKFVVGTQFVRSESDTPEITAVQEGTKSFIVTQNLLEVIS